MAVDLPESPNSREESYLASIAGQNVEVPECPWSRKEAYLDAINGRVESLQDELEELENNPDVADIVDTYADLEAYDTSTLTDKDIIRVLNDETHDGNSTYYRYSKATDSFTYIGSSKTYDVFTGTDGTTAGTKGLVPAPATTDAGKFLKADGTWDEAGGGIKTLTTADYNWPTTGTKTQIALWLLEPGIYKSKTSGSSLQITPVSGMNATLNGDEIVIITKSGNNSILSIYPYNHATYKGLNMFAANSSTGAKKSLGGFNNSILTTGSVYDNLNATYDYLPLSANQGRILNAYIGDLSTLTTTAKTSTVAAINELDSDLGKVEPLSGSGAPTTSTAGVVGQDYVDTATGDKYYLSAIVEESGQPDSYTWVKYATGSGGPTVVQTTGTSQTDVMSQDAVTKRLYMPWYVNSQNTYNVTDIAVTGDRIAKLANNATSVVHNIAILTGSGTDTFSSNSSYNIIIGGRSGNRTVDGSNRIEIGALATASGEAIAIGPSASATQRGSIALGARSSATAQGQFDIGSTSTTYGYNNSNYRLLTGLYPGQSEHDAATVGQLPAVFTNSQFNSILENA